MKRFIALILAALILAALSVPSIAAECDHNYLREFKEATCREKGHTLYTCRRCGDTYKVYDDEYTAPEDFYIIAESERDGDTLSVTVSLFNNPGLAAGRVKLGYNGDTLSVREFINGEIWSEKDFTAGVNTQSNPISVFSEDYTTADRNNTNNGVYFTVIFDITDPEGEYNIYLQSNRADFPSWDGTINTPTFINIAGKSELGDHSYTETAVEPGCTEGGYILHSCSICGDSYKDSETAPAGHSWEYSSRTKEPTFTEEGADLYVCSVCHEEKEEPVPVLERFNKGDISGDGAINSIDANLLKRILVGFVASLQQVDAADVDSDGNTNAVDASLLKRMISGQ